MTNMAEAISAFERARTETDVVGLYDGCAEFLEHGGSKIRLYRLELSVLGAAITYILGTLKVRRSLGGLRRSVLLIENDADREMTDAERIQVVDVARRMHHCLERDEEVYQKVVHFFDEKLAAFSAEFSWITRYAIRMERRIQESYLREEEDLVETLALIASPSFIQSVVQTLAHHSGQTSG